jgi:serine/threonine-protein kinase HipA
MIADAVDVVLDDALFDAPVEVGVLSREGRGETEVIRFAYSDAWLSSVPRAFPIDPELPLHPGDTFPSARRILFGVLRDTAPDRWGRVLMERREALEARREGRRPARLGEWAFLLGVSDVARIGALRLRGRDDPRYLDDRLLGVPPATHLRELEAAALALDEPDSEERPEYETWLRLLLAPGTSLGGARPKATFSDPDGTLWIAKFPGRQDRHDVGSWELFAHRLSVKAHIHRPEARQTKLGSDHHTFVVKRFDREAGRRRLYASAMTLAAKNDGELASYLDIAQAVQDHGDPQALESDLAELYRRAVFNVLVGNRDDHLRNHGFLRGPEGWRLAPAFDVNPNPDRDEHALTLDGSSAVPDVATVRSTRELYRLREADAARIEDEVRRAFEDWPSMARGLGIGSREIQRLETVIDPGR